MIVIFNVSLYRICFMFRTAERTFATVECVFRTAEYTFRSAECTYRSAERRIDTC